MRQGSRVQFDIIQPHPIEGAIVVCLGVALASDALWLPAVMEPYFGKPDFRFWTNIAGVVLIGAGLWRTGWRHRMVIDAQSQEITTRQGLLGIGRRRSYGFDEIRAVRLHREFGVSNRSGGGSRRTVHFPITLEGPVVSVDAGWSGRYEESRARAVRIAEALQVPLQDLTL